MYVSLTLSQIIKEFLADQEISETTRDKYQRTLQQLFLWADRTGKDKYNLSRADLISWKVDLKKERAISTTGFYITVVKKFFFWCGVKKYCDNISKGLKAPSRNRIFRKRPLELTDQKRLVESIDRSPLIGKRDYCMILLMLTCGLRTIELVRLNVEDISNEEGETVLLIQGKGHMEKDDVVQLDDGVMDAISEYLEEREENNYSAPLFVNHSHRNPGTRITTDVIRKMVKRRLRAIGIDSKDFTAHSLRHTAAVNLIDLGLELAEVQRFLRHSSLKTTELYIHTIERKRKIKRSAGSIIYKAISGDLNSSDKETPTTTQK